MSSKAGPPSWLFSNNISNTTKVKSATASNRQNPVPESDEMAKKASKPMASKADAKAAAPSAELLGLVGDFLTEHAFTKAHSAFQKEIEKNGWSTSKKDGDVSLISIFQSWETAQNSKAESEDNTDDSSGESSSSDNSSNNDSSESDGENDDDSESSESESEHEKKPAKKAAVPAKKAVAAGSKNLKRKAPVDTSSSESSDSSKSESESDSSSDSDAAPKAKKQKIAKPPTKSDSESSDSESDSDNGKMDVDKNSSGSSSSESDSSSDSDSDSESDDGKAEAQAAAKVALPESDSSSSDSSSDSGSDSDDQKAQPNAKKSKVSSSKDSSDTSVTLDTQSPVPKSKSEEPPLPPDPTLNRRKKQNEPFSRIPKNVKVDPKFSSNAYVHVGYSQRAHEDLIVTKGKGFTKEKNKKKRGSFRGGAIDISHSGSIYFDD